MKTINSILIANRGEIACRIIHTCRKMGIRTVAVFSHADRHSLFVKQADTAVYLGESQPTQSYLNQDKLIELAQKTQVDALHPGFGFLAENAEFAQKCANAGIIFIGPSPAAIAAMGSKSGAKQIMQKAGVPCVPGYENPNNQTTHTLTHEALKIGFPVLLKAAAGGGGKGMRIVYDKKELENAIQSAKNEAQNAFGSDELIIEKYIESARHIEFQVVGDNFGHVIHLLERECTIQRRYQKIIEESPSPVLSPQLREQMGNIAVKAAQAIHYNNAGTVEFILAENAQREHHFYFLEMNTRLQVEHPVTEEITGIDLVQLQIEIAENKPIALLQNEIKANGYAIECRLYAEDPMQNFMPVTGTVLKWQVPAMQSLRVETDMVSGAEISTFYDPMIAKIITHAPNRAAAHRKMEYALKNLQCLGTITNQNFLLFLLQNTQFQQGNYDTHFIQNKVNWAEFMPKNNANTQIAAIAATLFRWHERQKNTTLLRAIPSGWRNNFYQNQFENWQLGEQQIKVNYRYLEANKFIFDIENIPFQIENCRFSNHEIAVEIDGQIWNFSLVNAKENYYLHSSELGTFVLKLQERFAAKQTQKTKGGYATPMPAQILKIWVQEGQQVQEGEPLFVITSMKMENTIYAHQAGVVDAIFASEGDNLEAGFQVLKLQ